MRARGRGRKLARERVGCSARGHGARAGGGGERGGKGVRRREGGAVVGREHQAEVGERGVGVVTGERVEEGVPRGDITRGGGDILEDSEGGREDWPREGAVEGDYGVGDGCVGGRAGLDRPAMEGLAGARGAGDRGGAA